MALPLRGSHGEQCSPPAYKRPGILAQYAFSMDFSLMWEWGGAKTKAFDVVSDSIQDMPPNTPYPCFWRGQWWGVPDQDLPQIWDWLRREYMHSWLRRMN